MSTQFMTFTGREPHPVIPLLDERRINIAKRAEEVEAYYQTRAKLMALARHDPLRYGYEPPVWKVADRQLEELRKLFPSGVTHLLNLGGNRASKTERAAKRIVQLMVTKPGARVWCLHSTEAASQADQQPLIFRYLPPEWRPDTTGKSRYGRTTKIVYSDAGGFTKNTFILPNGSQCWFKFYGANVKTLEGAEVDMCWSDELVEPDWIEALTFRLLNRNGHNLITFTPVEGYSSTVKMFLQGHLVLEEEEAELLPIHDENGQIVGHEKLPRISQSGIPNARIINFWTQDNPFGNYEGMKTELRGSNKERIMMRAYGWPTKGSSTQFNFDQSAHVISEKQFADIVRRFPNGTRYHLVDPCSGRNWFMGWAYCPYNVSVTLPDGSISMEPKVIWYREWPSYGHPKAYIDGVGDPGPWATLIGTKARREGTRPPEDGERGPAQEPKKFSLRRYMQEIKHCEGNEVIFERWMDSRYGNSPKEEEEGTTTLIEQMENLGMSFCAMTSEKKILGVNDGSIDLINSALYYDKTVPMGEYSPELARINEPLMQVVDVCPNMIFAGETWTGRDGQQGACKDPVDIWRGFYLSRLSHIGEMTPVGGGSY